jgi:ABC-2 type transport system ATP-binding protein
MYPNLKVVDYLNFFEKILLVSHQKEKVMSLFGLADLSKVKIHSLSLNQKKRLAFAREFLKLPEVLLVQEPLTNLDSDSLKIIMEAYQFARVNGTTILTFSSSYRDILLSGEENYRLTDTGFVPFSSITQEAVNDAQVEEKLFDKTTIKVEHVQVNKVQAKLEDRLLLFDAIDIDYIEATGGECLLNVRGERFNCPHSLIELEERLTHLGFFRSHRSYLVNLQRVKEVITWSRNSYSLALDDKINSIIPLSKGRILELKTIMGIK